jgi:UDPglucose--hexose-1-phosphate uridylyltransferase
MTVEEIACVLRAAQARFYTIAMDPRVSHIAMFRNHGAAAGTSLTHPHSQILASPIAPMVVRQEIEEARRHYDDHLHCIYCELLEQESEAGRRVLLDNESFLVLEPFASRFPFETWILPKQHASALALAEEAGVLALAAALHTTLASLYGALGDPPYNLVLHEAPLRDSCEDYYHWHFEVLPRLATPAGFELSTGIYINTVLPEDSAEYLREFVPSGEQPRLARTG